MQVSKIKYINKNFVKFEFLKIINYQDINEYKIKFCNTINKLFIYLSNLVINKN
jgi:hypothetical protein